MQVFDTVYDNGVMYTRYSWRPGIALGEDGSVLFNGLKMPPPARELIERAWLRSELKESAQK